MKACSAYCRPDEGVHVWACRSILAADALQSYNGSVFHCTERTFSCMAPGTRWVQVGAEEAVECDLPEVEGHPHVVLVTSKVAA